MRQTPFNQDAARGLYRIGTLCDSLRKEMETGINDGRLSAMETMIYSYLIAGIERTYIDLDRHFDASGTGSMAALVNLTPQPFELSTLPVVTLCPPQLRDILANAMKHAGDMATIHVFDTGEEIEALVELSHGRCAKIHHSENIALSLPR